MKTLNILIADDHSSVRKGIILSLRPAGIGENFYEAGNGLEALSLLSQHPIDLVILDIRMPELSGAEAVIPIRSDFPQVKILVMTILEDRHLLKELVTNGVNGYLQKGDDDLEKAVITVMRGGFYVSPNLNQHIAFVQDKSAVSRPVLATPLQMKLIRLLAGGKSSREISDILGLSQSTVDTYRKHLLNDFKVANTAELVQYANDVGIL